MFAQVQRFFSTLVMPGVAAREPANALLESADSRGGLDQQHARELRAAAQAFLRVVR